MEMCEEADVEVIGRSVFIRLKSGAAAFVPRDKICEAIERYGICLSSLEKKGIRC